MEYHRTTAICSRLDEAFLRVPISHRHKTIFVHVPKTGGTSIEAVLGMHGDRDDVGIVPYANQTADRTHLYGRQLQHLTAKGLRAELNDEATFARYFKFAIVRNPWDRLVSTCAWSGQKWAQGRMLERAEMRDGKWTKVPCGANRKPVDASSASSGRSFDEVVAAAGADGDLGIGFVLGDGWAGVDLDGTVDSASGEITSSDVAAWIKTTRSYVERTPSKTGLHVIFKDVVKPEWSMNRRDFVELYVGARFFTFTGDSLHADCDVLADQAAIDALRDKWLRKDKPKPSSPAGAKRKRNPDNSTDD